MAPVTKSGQLGVALALLWVFGTAGSAAQTVETNGEAEAAGSPQAAPRGGGGTDGVRERDPQDAALLARMAVLTGRPGALEAAGDALGHAERALAKAAEHERMGSMPAAERARLIARAAVLLAERQVALEEERRAMRAALRRVTGAIAKARQARQALEHARAERNRVRQEEATSPRSREPDDQGENE